MKKLKLLLLTAAIILLYGCTCLAQIPDQVVYVDGNCQALLPDYIPLVTVSDNCEGVVVEQQPAPGTLLEAATPVIDVTVTATDAFGNVSSISFRTIAVDTIAPVITPSAELMTFNIEKAGDLYRASHIYTANAINQGIAERPDSILALYPGLATWDTVWDEKSMVMFFPPGGQGTYFGTWYNPGQYLCGCDSTEYMAQFEGYTVINLQFE